MIAARTSAPAQTTGTAKINSPVLQTSIINIGCIQDKTPQATVSVKQEPTTMTQAAPTDRLLFGVV